MRAALRPPLSARAHMRARAHAAALGRAQAVRAGACAACAARDGAQGGARSAASKVVTAHAICDDHLHLLGAPLGSSPSRRTQQTVSGDAGRTGTWRGETLPEDGAIASRPTPDDACGAPRGFTPPFTPRGFCAPWSAPDARGWRVIGFSAPYPSSRCSRTDHVGGGVPSAAADGATRVRGCGSLRGEGCTHGPGSRAQPHPCRRRGTSRHGHARECRLSASVGARPPARARSLRSRASGRVGWHGAHSSALAGAPPLASACGSSLEP